MYTDDIITNYNQTNNNLYIDHLYYLNNLYYFLNEDIELKNKIPIDLRNYIYNSVEKQKYKLPNSLIINGLEFAKKLEDGSLYEYLNEYLSDDEIYNKVFPKLPKDYDKTKNNKGYYYKYKSKSKIYNKNIKYYNSIYYEKLDKLDNNIKNGVLF